MDDNKKNKDNNTLDEEIEQVFRVTPGTLPHPRDKYFDKIWTTIETRAPVGEKYYLRSFFIILFGILFVVVFVLFYSDFLSSMVTLKEIRKENAAFFTGTPPATAGRITIPGGIRNKVITAGVQLDAIEGTDFRVDSHDPKITDVHIFSGHAVVRKHNDSKPLTVELPDINIFMNQPGSQCNIFCYDGMIRIVPLNIPVQVKYGDTTETVEPGAAFYFLDGKKGR